MTTDVNAAAELDQMGPVDYLVVGFASSEMTGEALRILVDLVDKGTIRILDLAFIRKQEDGTVTTLSQVDLERMKILEAALFEGASSGLLGMDDLVEAGKALEPGTAAGILVYENVWALPFATALRKAGGQVAASGHVPIQAIVAALDTAEAAQAVG